MLVAICLAHGAHEGTRAHPMKRLARDHYELSTGRQFYANRGLIGLAQNGSDDEGATPSGFTVSYGYDGYVDLDPFDEDERAWTVDERRELAEFMIAQWRAFGDGQP